MSSSSEENFFPTDDEDYSSEEGGSGSGEGENVVQRRVHKEEGVKRVHAVLDSLMGCHDYEFNVQSVYEEKGEDVFGPSSSVRHSTACAPIPTPDFAHFSVGLKGDYMEVKWQQTKGLDSKLSIYEGTNEFASEKIKGDSQMEQFQFGYTINYCKHYHIAISKQDDSEVAKKSIVTPLKSEGFAPDFHVEVSAAESRGEATLSWFHDFPCIASYKVRVSDDFGNSGEIMAIPKEDHVEVTVDLNMVPGLLDLVNCRQYHINIVPNGNKDLSRMRDFVYTDSGSPPNIQSTNNVKVTTTHNEATLSWINHLTCTDLRAQFSTRIGVHEVYDFAVEKRIYPKLGETSVTARNLTPCTSYEIRLYAADDEVTLIRKFQTEQLDQLETIDLLNDDDVIVWMDEVDPTEVKIEWTNRCMKNGYKVSICQEMEKCQIYDATATALTLQSLKACSSYDYNITTDIDGESLILYSSNFSTDFEAAFTFKPQDLLVQAAENSTGVEISWQNSPPCFIGYHIAILDRGVKMVENETLNEDTVNIILPFMENVSVENCINLTLIITPKLSTSNEFGEFISTFEYFTGPTPPDQINLITVDDSSALLNWTSTQCDTGYEVAVTLEEGGETIFYSSDIPKAELLLEKLIPCTKYEMKISTLGSYGIKSTEFITNHDEIQIVSKADFESVSLDVLFLDHGSHCVHHYVMFLCDFEETRSCYNRTLQRSKDETKKDITFDNLAEGTSYAYQLIGYGSALNEVFFTAEYQLMTRQHITAELLSLKELSTAESFKLQINSSIDEEQQWNAKILCTNEDGDFNQMKNVSMEQIVTINELPPDTEFLCSGSFHQEENHAQFASVRAFTIGGIPEAPLFLRTNSSTLELPTISLEWEEPIRSNGLIEEYKITLTPRCVEKNRYCIKFCPEKSEFFSTETSIEVELSPALKYDVAVSARTRGNPTYGERSNSLVMEIPANKTAPKLSHVKAMSVNGLRLTFKPSCPMTSEAEFEPKFICDGCRFQPKGVIKRKSAFTFEITELPGGNFYQVWVEDEEGLRSSVKVAYLECEHQCDDGFCVNTRRKKKSIKCDFVPDCPDGSDEWNCTCDAPDRFSCGNGHCIDGSKRCDGNADCNDFSDEAECPSCHGGSMFRCETSEECIPMNMTCDRKVQCRDGSDEHGCAYWTSTCWPEMFRCLDHTCVDMIHRCNGVWDCVGGEDEVGCGSSAICKEDGFACRDGSCVKMASYCDGHADCEDGTDELQGCECHTKGMFACSDLNCISRLKVCDGRRDCADGSDESGCYRKNVSPKFKAIITTTMAPPPPTNTNLAQQDSTANSYVELDEPEDEYYDLIRPIPSAPHDIIQSASQIKHK